MTWFKLDCVVMDGGDPALIRLEDVSSIGPTLKVLINSDGLEASWGDARVVFMRTGAQYAVTPESAARLVQVLEDAEERRLDDGGVPRTDLLAPCRCGHLLGEHYETDQRCAQCGCREFRS